MISDVEYILMWILVICIRHSENGEMSIIHLLLFFYIELHELFL